MSSPTSAIACRLRKIPPGTQVHCIEMQPGNGGQMCRTAGVHAVMNAREGNWAQITLPSGEVRRLPSTCRATIGVIGNSDHINVSIGKAGRKRWMGRRPHVRGVAMNPVAHPMGGGEGRTPADVILAVRPACSPRGTDAETPQALSKAIIRRRKSRRYGQLKI